MRLIDADALRARLHGVDDAGTFIYVDRLLEYIDDAPTIEPERKKEKWEAVEAADGGTDFRCSACHRYRFHNGEMLKRYKFCPNCGSAMDMTEGEG